MIDVRAQQLIDQGNALAQAGDLVRAEQYLAEGIERGADERRNLPNLLRVCVAASRYRAAVNYAAHYLQSHPGDWSLRFLVATIHEELGEHFTARRHFEEVLRARETHAGAHFMLGKILRETYSDPQSADVHFRRYLEIEPSGSHAEEARGHLLHIVTPGAATEPSAPVMHPVVPTETPPTTTPSPTPLAPPPAAPATRPASPTSVRQVPR